MSGHLLDEPVALTFIGRCRPDGPLGAGQVMELQLWNATTSSAIGTSLVVDVAVAAGQRYVLRDIALPLRDFDLTYRTRILGGLRVRDGVELQDRRRGGIRMRLNDGSH